MKSSFRIAAVIAATTLGAGMFALPYVFLESGWAVGLFYLVVLGAVTVFAHTLYWQMLEATGGQEDLLGMARENLGRLGYCVGLFSLLLGLILALVVYLILGVEFVRLFWPGANGTLALLLFWFIGVSPLFFGEKRILWFETLGIFFMAAIIFIIFVSALPGDRQFYIPTLNTANVFLPFGVVLFSLAGWTAIEPLFRGISSFGESGRRVPSSAIAWGTSAVALLYLIFVWGIFGSAKSIVPDTISGLSSWPQWKLGILGIVGLFALWTSYVPIGLEIKNALQSDLRFPRRLSLPLVIFLPLVLVFAGFSSFLGVVSFAGGVFLSLQYVLIALVGQKILRLRGAKKFSIFVLVVVFTLAAIYEVYYFVVG